MLVQEATANPARRVAALEAQVGRLIAGRVRDEQEARDLRERLTSAEDDAAAAHASAADCCAATEEVGALPLWGVSQI